MAVRSCVNIDTPVRRLRETNNSLLNKLRQGQRDTWRIMNRMELGKAPLSSRSRETSFTFRGTDRTPVSVTRSERRLSNSPKDAASTTPKTYRAALTEGGNQRRSRTPKDMDRAPNSILLTPGSRVRNRKSPKKSLRVSFQESPERGRMFLDDANHREKSLLGYDWIAGILDNESYLSEKPDDFFDDIKEFRRVNKNDCYGKAFAERPFSPYKSTESRTGKEAEATEQYSCANSYTLNDRLFAVPMHGEDTPCTVCGTTREPEYETEGSYVRVSVPRSTLLSPYKVKPHRRVSFDPTDSVGLSSHCLAGWESSKPATIPAPSALDLRASLHQSRDTLDASRVSHFVPPASSNTSDLLDRSRSMRYGIQVLERERRKGTQPPHTTPYPVY